MKKAYIFAIISFLSIGLGSPFLVFAAYNYTEYGYSSSLYEPALTGYYDDSIGCVSTYSSQGSCGSYDIGYRYTTTPSDDYGYYKKTWSIFPVQNVDSYQDIHTLPYYPNVSYDVSYGDNQALNSYEGTWYGSANNNYTYSDYVYTNYTYSSDLYSH